MNQNKNHDETLFKRFLTLSKIRLLLLVAVVVLVAAACILCVGILRTSHVEIATGEAIDQTPTLVESTKALGQWEFLSIEDEELVDTLRRGVFTDDELLRIYKGKLSLGIDLGSITKESFSLRGDTLELVLPDIVLLNSDFIDELRTVSLFESGSWQAKDKASLRMRTDRMMRRRCLTKENFAIARENAENQLSDFFKALGYKHTVFQKAKKKR